MPSLFSMKCPEPIQVEEVFQQGRQWEEPFDGLGGWELELRAVVHGEKEVGRHVLLDSAWNKPLGMFLLRDFIKPTLC